MLISNHCQCKLVHLQLFRQPLSEAVFSNNSIHISHPESPQNIHTLQIRSTKISKALPLQCLISCTNLVLSNMQNPNCKIQRRKTFPSTKYSTHLYFHKMSVRSSSPAFLPYWHQHTEQLRYTCGQKQTTYQLLNHDLREKHNQFFHSK